MSLRYEVEVTLSSAKDLKNVNWRHGLTRPYAVAWVDEHRRISSQVDAEGDTFPSWNQTLIVPFDCPIEDANLYVDIVHAAYPEEDTKPFIGSGKLPLRDVVDEVGLGRRAERKIQLKRSSGRPQGTLELGVAVHDPRYRASEPYHSAPPYDMSRGQEYSGASYGAPPPGNPYGQPGYAQPSYGQPEYGYPVEEKRSSFGGMGTGLAIGAVAGVVGGIALAEGFDQLEDHIADEAADKVEDDLADGGDCDDYFD